MEYRHLPRHINGTDEMVVTHGDEGEDHVNTLAQVSAALNTDLENVTTELDLSQD
jgi:hypothetical protein